ncbi:MAG TPA: nuclear transport factor 2 family protein [Pirellulales bacterium]|jgi:ketosteroid isomerase-like protein|nr:nuclear transport factor 2 family protein [Pirellulales bacterium]
MHMKKAGFSLAMWLTLVGPCFGDNPMEPGEDTAAVEQATTAFYTSLNALFAGDNGPMQQVWSHADDVTYMGPAGGYHIGWNDVNENWESQAALKLGGKVEPADVHVTIGNELAFVQCYEHGNNLGAEGEVEPVSIRATSIFRKENGQWKMIGHHTDLLPYLEEPIVTTGQ